MVWLVRERLVEPECPRTFEVVYEDEDLFVVDKPAGLPMHPTATYHRNTLTYLLTERYGRDGPTICHRIDRETSGLVVCAKTPASERYVKAAFENRQVRKRYVAIVRGVLAEDEGIIDRPMGRAESGLHVLMEVKQPGQGAPAESGFQAIERGRDHTKVAMRPRTGRQHQLRVHLAAIGHPIVGDKLYGPEGADAFLESIDVGMTDALLARLGHERQALHAAELELLHPRSASPIRVECSLPADLERLWTQCKASQSGGAAATTRELASRMPQF